MKRRDAIAAVRQALDPGPQPYAHLDTRLATKLGGALFLIGIVYVLIVLPLAPPEHGAHGWAGIIALLVFAVGTGATMLRRRTPLSPDALLAVTYGGLVMAAVYRWIAGGGGAFHQLLLLCCLYGAAIHPARRAATVLAFTSLAAATPALYGDTGGEFLPLLAGHLALTWSLGMLILVWMTRMRALRAQVDEAREQADHLARIDALTGLGNRRALEEALPVAVAAARRANQPLSVMVADLDDFKLVNDTFGHHAGDDVLKEAARAFTNAVRVPDPCFRWGGDEFVALLPGADLATSGEVAGRVAAAVAAACTGPDGRPVQITVGTAELGATESGEQLVARADAALLDGKQRRTSAAA